MTTNQDITLSLCADELQTLSGLIDMVAEGVESKEFFAALHGVEADVARGILSKLSSMVAAGA